VTISGGSSGGGGISSAQNRFKPDCRMATTAAITLSGLQTIDTISGIADDRVLVKNQADPIFNGIYLQAAGAWARSEDMPAGEVAGGSQVIVQEGAVNEDTEHTCISDGSTIIGTDANAWRDTTGKEASKVNYDPSSSPLTETNVQTAIDALANAIPQQLTIDISGGGSNFNVVDATGYDIDRTNVTVLVIGILIADATIRIPAVTSIIHKVKFKDFEGNGVTSPTDFELDVIPTGSNKITNDLTGIPGVKFSLSGDYDSMEFESVDAVAEADREWIA